MATKSKKRKRRRAAADLARQAQRSFARGDFRQALKDAKVCYRQEPSDEHHRFLERACLARAQELHRFGMRDECRSVLKTLLELGVTEPSVERELPQLLVAVGLFDRSPAGGERVALEADAGLLAAAADHAVVRPDEAPASLVGIREGATSIRAALLALENGNEARAIARLKDISRNSPFADWRYFVRGLAAYYREDASQVRANWDRLDPARFAARIAAPLEALADPASANRNDEPVKRGLGKIAGEVLGGPVLAHLYDLRTHLAADRWSNALASLRKCHQTLRRSNPDLLRRIVQVLHATILRKGFASRLGELASLVDPLPMDPHWNRARALLWQFGENQDFRRAEKHWLLYLDDLAELECLSPTERPLAQALVWERIGQLNLCKYRSVPPPFRQFDEAVKRFQARAVECFRKSIQLGPRLLSAYEALASAQIEWKQPEQATETYRRLLDEFPENLEALLFLVRHHFQRDEPFEAREYAVRAQRLKPTNQVVLGLLWSAHVASARHYALNRQWDEGRAAFEAADKLDPAKQDAYHLLARKAVFELKARNFGLGEQLAEQAQRQAGEPAPALLVLAIEAVRYDLSQTPRRSFERQWKAALKKRCCSRTAGLMSAAMAAYFEVGVEYPGRAAHLKQLLAYLRRCSRVKWEHGDLRGVCLFLNTLIEREELDPEAQLLERLSRKGLRKFPDEPVFHALAGYLEVVKGPHRCNRRYVRTCFEKTVELAKGCDDPQVAPLVERAKVFLSFIEAGEFGLPYPGSSFDDEDDEDDEDDDEELFAGPLPDDFFGPDVDSPGQMSPGELFQMFIRMCRELGLDPEEVLNEADAAGPIRLRRPERRSPKKRKKKKRR